ncbi:MAG: hypothetical protein K0Q86_1288 [Arthrobacter koreensis]|nr:hypothetical protein [Arthrobacter koreensis]
MTSSAAVLMARGAGRRVLRAEICGGRGAAAGADGEWSGRCGVLAAGRGWTGALAGCPVVVASWLAFVSAVLSTGSVLDPSSAAGEECALVRREAGDESASWMTASGKRAQPNRRSPIPVCPAVESGGCRPAVFLACRSWSGDKVLPPGGRRGPGCRMRLAREWVPARDERGAAGGVVIIVAAFTRPEESKLRRDPEGARRRLNATRQCSGCGLCCPEPVSPRPRFFSRGPVGRAEALVSAVGVELPAPEVGVARAEVEHHNSGDSGQ